MKSKIIYMSLALSLLAYPSFARTSSTEGISRQVVAIKNSLESFRQSMVGRVGVLERDVEELKEQFKPCGDDKYGSLQYETCSAGGSIDLPGFVLNQCQDGEWKQEVNACIPEVGFGASTSFMIGSHDLTFSALHQALVSQSLISGTIRGGYHISSDLGTLNAICTGVGFEGYKRDSLNDRRHSSCGDEYHLYAYNGTMQTVRAAYVGHCRMARRFVCTNVSEDVQRPTQRNRPPLTSLPTSPGDQR